jgi:hypothetical protein
MYDAAGFEDRDNSMAANHDPGFEASRRHFLQGVGVVVAAMMVLPVCGVGEASVETEWLGGY